MTKYLTIAGLLFLLILAPARADLGDKKPEETEQVHNYDDTVGTPVKAEPKTYFDDLIKPKPQAVPAPTLRPVKPQIVPLNFESPASQVRAALADARTLGPKQ